jgi:hypothetical protein
MFAMTLDTIESSAVMVTALRVGVFVTLTSLPTAHAPTNGPTKSRCEQYIDWI